MLFTCHPGYETSERSYPVVYLLHGYSDDETGWIQFGEVDQHCRRRHCQRRNYTDDHRNAGRWSDILYQRSTMENERWSDMFVQEFIPHILKKVIASVVSRRYRGIAGLSMGGYRFSLYHAMRVSRSLFGLCCIQLRQCGQRMN